MRRRTSGCLHQPMVAVAVVASALGPGCGPSTGAKDAGATVIMADCTWPSCLTDLFAACVPSGDCTAWADYVKGTVLVCYANGVKIQTVATTTPSVVETCKNGSTVSLSVETRTLFTNGIASGDAFTIRDGSGTTVATGTFDRSGTRVACSTGPTFVLPDTCGVPSAYGLPTLDAGGIDTLCDELPICTP